MSAQLDQAPAKPLTFRRYKDGDTKPLAWQQEIFDADHSHKCPTYIQSTPPCQGSCPSGPCAPGASCACSSAAGAVVPPPQATKAKSISTMADGINVRFARPSWSMII